MSHCYQTIPLPVTLILFMTFIYIYGLDIVHAVSWFWFKIPRLVYNRCCSSTGELKGPLHLPCCQQFSVQRLCPSKINFSAGCLPKSFSRFILSLWRSPCLASLVFSSFFSFFILHFLKRPFSVSAQFFIELLFTNLPLARGAGLWASIALFYIPGELGWGRGNNSSCISRTEFSTGGSFPLEQVLPLQSEGMLIHRTSWEQIFDRILMPLIFQISIVIDTTIPVPHFLLTLCAHQLPWFISKPRHKNTLKPSQVLLLFQNSSAFFFLC